MLTSGDDDEDDELQEGAKKPSFTFASASTSSSASSSSSSTSESFLADSANEVSSHQGVLRNRLSNSSEQYPIDPAVPVRRGNQPVSLPRREVSGRKKR